MSQRSESPSPAATLGAVIVAAGRGERFGGPKAGLTLDGVPLWRLARELMDGVGVPSVVVGDVPDGVPGGERRRDSVAHGVAALGDVEYVLVHDVARPLADAALVRRVIDRLVRGDVDGVVPGVAVPDTLKRVDGELVLDTIDRSDVVVVQTPQGFKRSALVEAHAAAPDLDATDDAGLVELAGGRVVIVDGDRDNFKITWPDDLTRAEGVRERRMGDD